MNRLTLLCLGLITPALLQTSSLASAADNAHEHHHAPQSSVMPQHDAHANQPAKHWETDAALREGMTRIRTALADNMAAMHDQSLNADGYNALATTLESALSGIFANCKLPPAADAELHKILLPMHAAVGQMQKASTQQERHQAAQTVLNSLGDYGKTFDHPGWQPL